MDNALILYAVKSAISIALFYGVYMLCLKNDTFLKLRRFYFLFAILFSLTFPVISLELPAQPESTNNFPVPTYWLSQLEPANDLVMEQSTESVVSIWTILIVGFAIVSLFLIFKFVLELAHIIRFRITNTSDKIGSIRVIKLNDTENTVFSFFNWVFISSETKKDHEWEEMIIHEQVHAQQFHSFDVILMEIVTIFFWWNPFVWLLKKEMKINLEYLADEGVLKAGFDSKSYQYTLLQVSTKNAGIPFINNFNVSQLKKRIIMMNKKKSSIIKSAKYLLILPIGFALILGNAVQASPELNINFGSEESLSKQISVQDNSPSFPGGVSEMQRFLSSNIKYPIEAQEKDLQGEVWVNFTVKKTGEVLDVKLIKKADPLLDNEIMRVVKSMPKWESGDADLNTTLPFVFALRKEGVKAITPSDDQEHTMIVGYGSAPKVQTVNNNQQKNKPFVTVEEMPRFPGGEAAMHKFLSDNMKYPVDAFEAGIQGRVVVRYVVDEEGNVKDATVIRGRNQSLENEALRIVNLMPKWEPGKQRGKAVAVYYTLPVVFKLNKNKTE